MSGRSRIGLEVEEALNEAPAHVRGDVVLSTRDISPATPDVSAIREGMKLSRPKFADRFGLDARAVRDWDHGRRRPGKAARRALGAE